MRLLISSFLVCSSLLLAGCVTSKPTAQLPPAPPGMDMVPMANARVLVIVEKPPVRHITLTWRYPYDDPSLTGFDVWMGDPATPLSKIGSTTNTFFTLDDSAWVRYFAVSPVR